MSNVRTLVLVDDNPDFRQSTTWLLEASGYEVFDFGMARKALHWFDQSLAHTPWCMLLDVRMPGMDGLDMHEELQRRKVRIPVIYLTGHATVPLAVEAMNKGAISFLEKPLQFKSLEKALGIAFNAQSQPIPSEDTDRTEEFRKRLSLLTPRETEVMHSIVEGKANKVSAIDLGISIKTVDVHRTRLMKKLGVRSGPELVRLAMSCQ